MFWRQIFSGFVGIVAIIALSECQKLPVDPELGENMFMHLINAMNHLDKYGYLTLDPAKGDTNLNMTATSHAISDYQKFHGLSISNVVDSVTVEHMKKPRCGCRDPVELMIGDWNATQLRYTTAGDKWEKTDLKYRVSRIPETLDKRTVKQFVRKAFKLWSETTSLTFTEAKKSEDVDIWIQFASLYHKGPRNFDGKFGDIAHAFSPVPREIGYSHLAGNVHLDDEEKWVIEGGDGETSFNLLPVILHEIGHALGLSHSTQPESIMTAMVTEIRGDVRVNLSQDDVEGIQSLYGPKMMENIAQQTCVTVEPSYDAMANLFGEIYVFKGDKYWRIESPGVTAASPGEEGALINSVWPGAPSNVDAVYQSFKTWNIIFIKGDLFWVYAGIENHPLLPDYPKPLRTLTLPDDLDAAVHTGDKTYFIKGRHVWEMDEESDEALGSSVPRIQEYNRWKKMPSHIDTAFYYDGEIYFVKGDGYHHLDINRRKVKKVKDSSVRSHFFGCHI